MAGSKTDAFEARLLDHLFAGGASPSLVALSTVYVALYTAGPTDSSAGTEVSGSSYARASAASTVWTRSGTNPTQVANNAQISFPTVTSSTYTVVGWAIMDASTGGNQLYWGDMPATTMNVGDVPKFAASALVVTED